MSKEGDIDTAAAEAEEALGPDDGAEDPGTAVLASVNRVAQEEAERTKKRILAAIDEKIKKGRSRRPYNYTLQQKLEAKQGDRTTWFDSKDGFVSPEQAIEFVTKAKLVGTFRAVRVASDEYVAELRTPEPVLTVTRVKKQKEKGK